MAVAPIKRIHIVCHRSMQETMLVLLQDIGVIHISPLSEDETSDLLEPVGSDTRDIEKKLTEVEGAVTYLGRFVPPGGLLSSFLGGKIELTPAQFGELSEEHRVDRILEEVKDLEQEVAELDIRTSRLNSAIHHLQPWAPLQIPLEKLEPTSHTAIFSGSVPMAALDTLRENLARGGNGWVLEETSRSGGRAYIVLVELADEALDGERLLREAGFQPAAFPSEQGSVEEIVARMGHEVGELSSQREKLLAKASELAKHRITLMAAYDSLAQAKARIEGLSEASGTKDSVVLSGWCLSEQIQKLEKALSSLSPETAVITRDPLPEEKPPVALNNKTAVRPFQVVTNLYGLPKSTEIDPTPLLAPFFVLSFGIAVGEGGYGVLLAVLSKLGLKFLRLEEGGRRLLNLLFYCGIATFIAGVLMGSFFAIDFASLPEFLQPISSLFEHLQLFNPLEDSLLFLGIVLGLGFFQVWVGVLIGGIIKWRRGDRKTALFHDGGWLVLLPLTAFLGKTIVGVPALYPWLVAAASIFVSAGFASAGVGGKIGAGIYALYGLTGFFGDILSYSRLFALGLATGVIAMVVNILASMTKGIPVIGWLIMLVVLIFGHIFNLAINALGAFIHTARLQFVEFFTKFFEGGGSHFEPFSRKFRYTTITTHHAGSSAGSKNPMVDTK